MILAGNWGSLQQYTIFTSQQCDFKIFFFCYFLCMLHIALNLIEQLNCFFRPIFNSNDSVTSNYLVDY